MEQEAHEEDRMCEGLVGSEEETIDLFFGCLWADGAGWGGMLAEGEVKSTPQLTGIVGQKLNALLYGGTSVCVCVCVRVCVCVCGGGGVVSVENTVI